jgi:hypothetical protein
MDLIDLGWQYLYNWDESTQQNFRANLVYTPYVDPDGSTLCMDFNRDTNYHQWEEENVLWNEKLLNDRFIRELKFYTIAKEYCPVLAIKDVDMNARRIFLEWHQDDFFTQAQKAGGYDNVLPDWKAQWLARIEEMYQAGVYKFSLHPNSWVAKDGVLIPFNWFFSFEKHEPKITIRDLLIQISPGRQDKLMEVLKSRGMNLDTPYEIKPLQIVCFNSFKANYPESLIDQAIKNHSVFA